MAHRSVQCWELPAVPGPPVLDHLLGAEVALDRSFASCAVTLLTKLGWMVCIIAMGGVADGWLALVDLALVLGAPVVASIIALPLVSAAIAASPLTVRFVLGAELRAAITERMFAE